MNLCNLTSCFFSSVFRFDLPSSEVMAALNCSQFVTISFASGHNLIVYHYYLFNSLVYD